MKRFLLFCLINFFCAELISQNLEIPREKQGTENLDYNLISKNALFFGPTLIKGNDYEIHCEKGNFDLKSSIGNFQKNPKIFYNNKIIEGDSIFYDESINFASATKKL